MTDKEVGDAWYKHAYQNTIRNLIRKLIEERKRYLATFNELNAYRHEGDFFHKDFTSEACKQFGIITDK